MIKGQAFGLSRKVFKDRVIFVVEGPLGTRAQVMFNNKFQELCRYDPYKVFLDLNPTEFLLNP